MPRPTELLRLAALAFFSTSCFGASASLKTSAGAPRAAGDLEPGATGALSISVAGQDPKKTVQDPKKDDDDEADDEVREEDDSDDDVSSGMGSDEDDDDAPVAGAPKTVESLSKQVAALEKRLATLEKMLETLGEKLIAQIGGARADAKLTPAAAGYQSARLTIGHNHSTANVRVTVNGVLVGRYDSSANIELAPFLQAGKLNKIGLAVTAPDAKSSTGISAYVEAKVPGSDQSLHVIQFNSSPGHLTDEFELPFAGEKNG